MITSDAGFLIATPTKCGTTTLEEMARRNGGGRVSRGGFENPSFAIYTGERPRRQHRMALPSGDQWAAADRYLMVRNPYMRYISMYEYLMHPTNYTKYGSQWLQGKEWGGLPRGRHSPWDYQEPATFQQFLQFIVSERKAYAHGRWARRRGPLDHPFAYRSPWVWLDSLMDSWVALMSQPRVGKIECGYIQLEFIWEHLAGLKDKYGLQDLNVRGSIHANKGLRMRVGGPRAYWNDVGCARELWGIDGGFRWRYVQWSSCCDCLACEVGVAKEASFFGYA
jgi:hypothetical protein